GELVFDPFGGSGTTALEALRLGRRALCTDANAIGLLAGRVKTARITADASTELRAVRTAVRSAGGSPLPGERPCAEYAPFVAPIPNRQRWFSDQASGELAFIREHIARLRTPAARDVATLALSRVVLRASFQDSETRYCAKPRAVEPGEVLDAYVRALE